MTDFSRLDGEDVARTTRLVMAAGRDASMLMASLRFRDQRILASYRRRRSVADVRRSEGYSRRQARTWLLEALDRERRGLWASSSTQRPMLISDLVGER